MTEKKEQINSALREHQAEAKDWELQKLLVDLHTWSGRMISEFRLEIDTPALSVEGLSVRKYGHFRRGRNGFGLRNEIAINARFLTTRPYWQVLGTLFHELLHEHQEAHGKPAKRNFHNREFREKAKSYGLVIDERGVTEYEPPPSPFSEFLKKYGVKMPKLPPAPPAKEKGKSKLKLWECGCGVKVRVGRAEFNATCNDCGEEFVLQE